MKVMITLFEVMRMSKLDKKLLVSKLNFAKHILSQFSELLTPMSAILYLEYYAQYLLFKCCADYNDDTVLIGSSFVLNKLHDVFYKNIIKTRNALAHCDKKEALQFIKLLSEFDYDEVPDILDMEMFKYYMPLSTVDWKALMTFIEEV